MKTDEQISIETERAYIKGFREGQELERKKLEQQMMKTFIQSQQEEARKILSKVEFLHGVPVQAPEKTLKEIDFLISQVVQNTLSEVEKEVEASIRYVGEGTYCFTCKQHVASGDCDCTGRNKGLLTVLTIIKDITK